MLKYSYLIPTLLILASCGSEKVTSDGKSYCDTKKFIETEISRLVSEQTGLRKNLSFNGKSQSTLQKQPDWTKELDALLAIDLRKINYKGRLDADTSVSGDSAYCVHYIANDDKLTLRNCTVLFRNSDGKIISLQALFDNQNSLFKSFKKLEYSPQSGYYITGTQEVKLGNTVSYEIKGDFVSP